MKIFATTVGSRIVTAVAMLLVFGSAIAGEEVLTDGVRHIINGSSSAQGVETINLEEMWRVGGEDGEDFFGLVSQVRFGDDGSIYLLDTQLSEVAVYSPDGERVGTLSRQGEGPGETNMPSDLVKMPDGNLGLVQSFPGKITKIDLQGDPLGEFQPKLEDGGFLFLMDCLTNVDGQLTISGRNFKQDGPMGRSETNFVSNFGPDGSETVRFTQIESSMDFTNLHIKEDERNEITFRRVAVAPDGRVFVAKWRNKYEIEVYLPDGKLDRIIERDFESRPRNDKEYNKIKNLAEAQLAPLPGAKFDVSKTEPDISSLRFGADGNLWVTTSRSGFQQPEGVLATYDLFGPDGNFVKQVVARCEGNGMQDVLFWASDGSVVLVTGFTDALFSLQSAGAGGAGSSEDDEEAEPMEVIRLRPVQ